jgi:hypothetical protein
VAAPENPTERGRITNPAYEEVFAPPSLPPGRPT